MFMERQDRTKRQDSLCGVVPNPPPLSVIALQTCLHSLLSQGSGIIPRMLNVISKI